MKKILLPVLGALALAACSVSPQYDLDRQVSGECASGEANMGALKAEQTVVAGEIYQNSSAVAVNADVANMLGGDYVEIAEAGGAAPSNDYWRHIELRHNDYAAACVGARAPNP
ncbi:MAG: hypothetical protein JNL25_15390 [Rhodospirillaceae bacterium]|nr:hypothetical protein [Rhodospirillaceae bacterium]